MLLLFAARNDYALNVRGCAAAGLNLSYATHGPRCIDENRPGQALRPECIVVVVVVFIIVVINDDTRKEKVISLLQQNKGGLGGKVS